MNRCFWTGNDSLYIEYHDKEWGKPVHDDNKLFEMLVLEGMQAGLSWITVLKKREAFRIAFDNFNPYKVALYNNEKIAELMNNPAIIRNSLKIHAAIENAKQFIKIQNEYGSFDKFIWSFTGYKPIINQVSNINPMPAFTPLSATISKQLKKRGFKFVGATIIYSFMQATGMVDDHFIDCFCHTYYNIR